VKTAAYLRYVEHFASRYDAEDRSFRDTGNYFKKGSNSLKAGVPAWFRSS